MTHNHDHQRGPHQRRVAIGGALALASLALTAQAAAAASVATTGISRVTVTSYQALPPPYKPGKTVLKSAAELLSFEQHLTADHVGTTTHPVATLCTGGISYEADIIYTKGHTVDLKAYYCGNSIIGNMTGRVKPFVKYLATLLPKTK
jgi:hypothetical protein